MRIEHRAAAAGVALFIGWSFPAAASAEPEAASPWQFQATLYVYLPTLSGTTMFPPEDGSSGISIDTSTILNNLKLTFMGSFEVHKDPWGAFTDVIYIDIGNTRSVSQGFYIGGLPLPAEVTANAEFDIKGWLWTLAATYRPISTSQYTLDVLAGTRLLDVKPKLSWQLSGNVGSVAPPDRTGTRESGVSNWDAVAGIKGRVNFAPGGGWFTLYYLDLGTGNSRFTSQVMVGAGYAFPWGELSAAWRYIDYQMKSSESIERLNLTGPLVAYQFRW